MGQKDPLVEYRFEGQRIFEEMMRNLRREVVFALASANPKSVANLRMETELTKAAGHAIENADEITSSQKEFEADDFSGTVRVIEEDEDLGEEVKLQSAKLNSKPKVQQKPSGNKSIKKKSNKKQRQNRKKGRR